MEGEDITTNTLARLISEVEPSIWQEAAQREWRVCLPQSFSIRRDLRKEDIYDHVLIPTNQTGKYKTKSGKTIRLCNNEITTCEGFPESRIVKVIVTQEVIVPSAFDGASTSICLIFYINSPLTGGIDAPSGVDNMTFSNLSEYLAFIFSYPENEVVLASLDKFIRNVKKSLKNGNHFFITPLSGQLCRRCDETVSYIRNTSALREAMLSNKAYNSNNIDSNIVDNKRYHAYDKQLRQCVESYLLFNLYNEIYKSILIEHEDETDMLEKGIMYMRKKKKSDFDIKDKYNCDTSLATKVLSKISSYKTPLEKAQCLQNTCDTILDCVRENIKQRNNNNNNQSNKTDDLETDDLLAQLIYTICDSYPATKYLYVDLIYIYDFHFENISVTNMGYTITNVEVALNWLKNQSNMRSNETTPVATKNNHIPSIMQEFPVLEPSSDSGDLHIPPCLIYDNDYMIDSNNDDLTSPNTNHEDYSPYRTYSNSRTIPHMSSWSNFSNKSQIRLSRFGSYTKLTSSPSS